MGGPGSGYSQQSFDMTGQIAPPGMKPRVTATLWEDEGSMCFQVEAKGVCVARRDGTVLSQLLPSIPFYLCWLRRIGTSSASECFVLFLKDLS